MPMQMYFPIMWWRISIFPNFALNSKQLTHAVLYLGHWLFPAFFTSWFLVFSKMKISLWFPFFATFSCIRLKPFHFWHLFQIHALKFAFFRSMSESELFKYWILKFSLGIGLAISFPLTSKPFTIMHKSSIMDFKKCFKEKKIVVYSRKKNKAQTCKVGINIKKDESGNNISKQMNTWALLISRWFSQWAISKRLWIPRNIFLIATLPQSKSSFFCGNPSLIYLCTNRPFEFAAHASLFLGCPFFIFYSFSIFLLFHYAFKNLNFVQNEWNFLFP